MGKTIFALFALTLCATLCEQLLPAGDRAGTGRVLKLLALLATLCLIITPLFGFLRDSPDDLFGLLEKDAAAPSVDYDEIFQSAVSNGSSEALREGLYDYLKQHHGMEVKDVTISFEFGKGGALEKVFLRLSGKGLLKDPKALETEISDLFNCQVEVR